MGCRGAGAKLRVGVISDRFANVDYLDELEEAIRDAFCQAYRLF